MSSQARWQFDGTAFTLQEGKKIIYSQRLPEQIQVLFKELTNVDEYRQLYEYIELAIDFNRIQSYIYVDNSIKRELIHKYYIVLKEKAQNLPNYTREVLDIHNFLLK